MIDIDQMVQKLFSLIPVPPSVPNGVCDRAFLGPQGPADYVIHTDPNASDNVRSSCQGCVYFRSLLSESRENRTQLPRNFRVEPPFTYYHTRGLHRYMHPMLASLKR